MTLELLAKCDGCGTAERPTAASGWLVMVFWPLGGAISGTEYHFCLDCQAKDRTLHSLLRLAERTNKVSVQ